MPRMTGRKPLQAVMEGEENPDQILTQFRAGTGRQHSGEDFEIHLRFVNVINQRAIHVGHREIVRGRCGNCRIRITHGVYSSLVTLWEVRAGV